MNAPFRPAVSATALLLALAASPAFAQVTAQEVWDDWQAQMSVYGEGGVTVGSEMYEGGVLTVTDLGFTVAGEDGSTASGTLAELVLSENGDGTVSVTMSEEYPITIVTPANPETGSAESEVQLALRQTGMTTTVSGTPGALTYDIAADRYAVELDSLVEGGVAVPAAMQLAFNDVSGNYTSTEGAMREIAYDLAAASMDILLDVPNPEDGSQVMLSGKVDGVATQATMSVPLDAAADPEAMMMNGLAVEGGYTTEGGSYLFEVMNPASGPSSGTITSGGSSLDFAVDSESIFYSSLASGVAMEITSAMMPMPVAISLEELGANLEMPMSRTDAPAPWAFGVNLSGLAIDEQIWAMFDPQALLARDPATVYLDLTGTATLLADLMDPAQAEAMAASPVPGQIDSVSIDGLEVTFGGASVTGTGAVTLDNTDLTTVPGMPKPTGAIDLELSGVNGLIDALVTIGLIPEDQAMVPRMMLGAFTTATGDDQATSRIEFTADGQILANGQRIQ